MDETYLVTGKAGCPYVRGDTERGVRLNYPCCINLLQRRSSTARTLVCDRAHCFEITRVQRRPDFDRREDVNGIVAICIRNGVRHCTVTRLRAPLICPSEHISIYIMRASHMHGATDRGDV